MTKKRKLEDYETIALAKECSTIIQNKLSPKLNDPRSFSIPCTIGNIEFSKALCDLGARVSLMPMTLAIQLGLSEFVMLPPLPSATPKVSAEHLPNSRQESIQF